MTGGAGFSRDAQNTNRQNRSMARKVRDNYFRRSKKAGGLSSRQKSREEQTEEKEMFAKAKRVYRVKFFLIITTALAASVLVVYFLL